MEKKFIGSINDRIIFVVSIFLSVTTFCYIDNVPSADMFFNMCIKILSVVVLSYGLARFVYHYMNKIDMRLNFKNTDLILIFSGLFFAVFGSMFVFWAGNRQFAAYDLSTIIDIGYRQFLGQRPYLDFPCQLPPGFYLPLKYAFCIFGVKYNSIIIIEIIFSVITFVWMSFLLKSITESVVISITLSLACQSLGVFIPSHWWHTSMTSIFASIFVCSVVLWIIRPSNMRYLFSYGISLFFLVLFKPNVVAPLVFGVIVAMMFVKAGRLKFIFVTLLTAVCDLVFISVFNGINIVDIIKSYLSVADARGNENNLLLSLSPVIGNLLHIVFYGLVFAPIVSYFFTDIRRLLNGIKRQPVLISVIFISLLCAVYGCYSSLDLKYSDFPLIIISTGILPFILKNKNDKIIIAEQAKDVNENTESVEMEQKFEIERSYIETYNNENIESEIDLFFKKVIFTVAVCFIALGVAMGGVRYRSVFAGPFFDYCKIVNIKDSNQFFSDFYGTPLFNIITIQVNDVVKKNPGKKFFFGTRMEFAYAANNLSSPKKLPVWWQLGTSYPKADEDKIIDSWINSKFDVVVFNKGDFSQIPNRMLRNIGWDYVVDNSYSNITVFYRKSRKSDNK